MRGDSLLWPDYAGPDDLAAIEGVPLAERGLPGSTYDLLCRAADLFPERTALSVLPEAARWRDHTTVTFAELRRSVNRAANLLHLLGVRRRHAVALLAPNCEELVVATLAAQAAGIAAPVNPGLGGRHLQELLERSGARILVAAGPELDASVWATAQELAAAGVVDTVLALRPTGATGPAPALPTIGGAPVGYLMELSSGRPRPPPTSPRSSTPAAPRGFPSWLRTRTPTR